LSDKINEEKSNESIDKNQSLLEKSKHTVASSLLDDNDETPKFLKRVIG